MKLNDADMQRLNRELNKLMKKASDDGRLIEVGWLSLRMMALPPDAPQIQIDEMRQAFFAGAHHLFASIMNVLEAGNDVTPTDLRRMDLIWSELDAFITLYAAKHGVDLPRAPGARA